MCKTRAIAASCLTFFVLGIFSGCEKKQPETPVPTGIEAAEKEKALKNPYPNDLGTEAVDISVYSPASQEGYRLLLDKCAKCHSASRPLHSQFVELSAEEISATKKSRPEIFSEPSVWQIEPGIWQRYVKRMMAKPGCKISSDEGRKIWRFLAEDSKWRKTGAAAAQWKTQRTKLLSEFKSKYPARSAELFP